jgi:hypothetical protein
MAIRNAINFDRRRQVWVKTRPFVSRSHGSFRQLRTSRDVDAGRQWAHGAGGVLARRPEVSGDCLTGAPALRAAAAP